MEDPDWRTLVADHQTVLYGEWKNGVRTPGIVEYIADAKSAAQKAESAANGIAERGDANRRLIFMSIATSILAPILVGLILVALTGHGVIR
jgi:hypothetical protein